MQKKIYCHFHMLYIAKLKEMFDLKFCYPSDQWMEKQSKQLNQTNWNPRNNGPEKLIVELSEGSVSSLWNYLSSLPTSFNTELSVWLLPPPPLRGPEAAWLVKFRDEKCTCPPLRSPYGDLRGRHVHFSRVWRRSEWTKTVKMRVEGSSPCGGRTQYNKDIERTYLGEELRENYCRRL